MVRKLLKFLKFYNFGKLLLCYSYRMQASYNQYSLYYIIMKTLWMVALVMFPSLLNHWVLNLDGLVEYSLYKSIKDVCHPGIENCTQKQSQKYQYQNWETLAKVMPKIFYTFRRELWNWSKLNNCTVTIKSGFMATLFLILLLFKSYL